MITGILLLVSFWLDGVLNNFLAYMVFDLSLFTPFLTLISLIIIYPYYRKKERNYFILLAIVGFCYDLFYTNLLFTHAIFFPFIGYLMSKLYQKFSVNGLTNLLLLATSLFLYQVLFCFFLLLFNIVPINWYNVLYLFLHSLVLNLLYGELLYFLCKLLPCKRRLN